MELAQTNKKMSKRLVWKNLINIDENLNLGIFNQNMKGQDYIEI